MEQQRDHSSGSDSAPPPPPEMHDAFAFLLEEIDHEDLARSMRLESARAAAAGAAAAGAAPLDPATPSLPGDASRQHYHLLATAEADAAAVLAPTELYIQSDAFNSEAQWLPPSTSMDESHAPQYELPIEAYAVNRRDTVAVDSTGSAADAGADTAPGAVPAPSPATTISDNSLASPSASQDVSASLEVADSSVANSTDDEKSSPAPPRKPMENSTRKRQKEELAYLRQKVLELETELSAMKDRARASALSRQQDEANSSTGDGGDSDASGSVAAPASSGSVPDSSGDQQQTAAPASQSAETRVAKVSLWERVAKRQLLEKQKAEMKNLKLKTALEDQLKIAKSLEKVLRKRPSATLSTQVLDTVQVLNNKRFCTLSRSDASIYDMLLANTEKVYAEVDNVYARNEFLHLEDDINDTKLKVDESNQLYMEITHAKIIPFDLQTTIDGVWQCLSLAQVPISDGVYEAVERTRDTICAKATMSLHVRNTETTVRTRFVMKRFDEPDRVILVCESTTHSEGPREVVHGIKVLEKGWIVIKPASVKKKDGGASTLIQLCMRMTPTITGDMLETQRRHTGAITDMILGSVNKSLGVMYQTVENILMESVAPPPSAP